MFASLPPSPSLPLPQPSPLPLPPWPRVVVFVVVLQLLLLQDQFGLMADAYRDDTDIENEAEQVEVVSGFNATLPCIIRIPANDAPLLTLWYLERNETPIYSYDQRTGVSGTSWADPRVFGGRAHYLAHLSPPAMLIMRVGVNDAKLYRCRIDFHNSNSREAWVRLTVIVPPERVEIAPQVARVVPGQRDDVVCTAIGGNPSPSVVWLQNGRIVDPNSTVGQSGSYNRLEVPASREDLTSPFTCQASNNNLTAPVTATYTRNVTCGPTQVTLEASEDPLLVGKPANITCRAIGSNPPAKITWYHQGKKIQKLTINVTREDTETISVLRLQPGRHHHGRQLLCRAENILLPLATLEDIITLNVAYRPHVRIEVAWPRRLELLTEGNDLLLECVVDANPPPYKIQFFLNGEVVDPNTIENALLNEATLVVQHINRHHSGDYHCEATNTRGQAPSKNISVNVRYLPVCAKNDTSIVGVRVGQATSLTCQVHAYPDDVNFTWTFVSKAGIAGGGGGGRGGGGGSPARGDEARPRIIDAEFYTCDGLTSTLTYTPKGQSDLGVFSCYATNKKGIQQHPCTFKLVTEGESPKRVENCSVTKVTTRAISVTCQPAQHSEKGQPQRFFHQVRVASTGELVLNKSSTEASLEVTSLNPGKRYVVSVTAFNAKGKAPSKTFHIQTLQEAKMHTSPPTRPHSKRFLWILASGAGIILTVALLLVALWLARGRRSSHTLRNRDLDSDKPDNSANIRGEVRQGGTNDAVCSNGLMMMQQTIYDSSGRYIGFAHMQQAENQGFGVMSSMCALAPNGQQQQQQQQPEKPSLQSRLSLLRKGSKDTPESAKSKAARDVTDAIKSIPEDEAREKGGGEEKENKEGEEEEEEEGEDGEIKRSGFIKWKWMVSHVTGGGGKEGSNRLLDLCRMAQSKHSQETQKNNSAPGSAL